MRNRSTWVALFFIAATALATFVFDLAVGDIFLSFRLENRPLLGPRFTTTTLIALAFASAIAVICAFVYRPARQFIEQAIAEMDKAHWPTLADTRVSTATVIATSFIAAVILGMFDTVVAWLTTNNFFLR